MLACDAGIASPSTQRPRCQLKAGESETGTLTTRLSTRHSAMTWQHLEKISYLWFYEILNAATLAAPLIKFVLHPDRISVTLEDLFEGNDLVMVRTRFSAGRTTSSYTIAASGAPRTHSSSPSRGTSKGQSWTPYESAKAPSKACRKEEGEWTSLEIPHCYCPP